MSNTVNTEAAAMIEASNALWEHRQTKDDIVDRRRYINRLAAEVIGLLARGYTMQWIAETLRIEEADVARYRNSAVSSLKWVSVDPDNYVRNEIVAPVSKGVTAHAKAIYNDDKQLEITTWFEVDGEDAFHLKTLGHRGVGPERPGARQAAAGAIRMEAQKDKEAIFAAENREDAAAALNAACESWLSDAVMTRIHTTMEAFIAGYTGSLKDVDHRLSLKFGSRYHQLIRNRENFASRL